MPAVTAHASWAPNVLVWLEVKEDSTGRTTTSHTIPKGRPRKASPSQIASARQGKGGAA
ncbi:hypothetical protein [Acidithiobacillus ferrivorans]|uniref:hypothetical protein n=1 Tax=Acidithiobacillus ferrivorans TaxID=160808 RepID=UPI001ED8E40A|nr:hypothetical protein [Acidithiobacillus ferrivorans]